jgi:hypothetical protein
MRNEYQTSLVPRSSLLRRHFTTEDTELISRIATEDTEFFDKKLSVTSALPPQISVASVVDVPGAVTSSAPRFLLGSPV